MTVILAHCAVPFFWFFDWDYQDDFKACLDLFEEADKNNWKLYADISALCSPLRIPYIDDVKNRIPHEKLLFGSDYPVPISELSYNRSKGFFSWLRFVVKVSMMENLLDKNYRLIEEMGFDRSVFTNCYSLFNAIKYT